jgi:hypothetical protein
MNGFEVEPELLRVAGRRVRNLADDCAAEPGLRYSARPELAGDTALATALASFQEASASAVKMLLRDADQLGERLGEAARLYEGHEQDARLAGPPGASA